MSKSKADSMLMTGALGGTLLGVLCFWALLLSNAAQEFEAAVFCALGLIIAALAVVRTVPQIAFGPAYIEPRGTLPTTALAVACLGVGVMWTYEEASVGAVPSFFSIFVAAALGATVVCAVLTEARLMMTPPPETPRRIRRIES